MCSCDKIALYATTEFFFLSDETGVSRHHGRPLELLGSSQHYRTEDLKGVFSIGPPFMAKTPVYRIANIYFSNQTSCQDRTFFHPRTESVTVPNLGVFLNLSGTVLFVISTWGFRGTLIWTPQYKGTPYSAGITKDFRDRSTQV